MKRISELKISPAPWRKAVNEFGMGEDIIWDANGNLVQYSGLNPYIPYERHKANHSMIVAAPEMYECLREAVVDMCHDCPNCGHYPDYRCKDTACWCLPNRWRKVLAKAAGESEANDVE